MLISFTYHSNLFLKLMRIPVTARLDIPGKTCSWKDLRGEIITEPLWYQVTLFVDDKTTVDCFIEKVNNYWSTVEYMYQAKLIDRPNMLKKNTTLHFVNESF